ncbi:MAG TPA: SRPBCC domain-containing protein [Salinimicrobium sp.]|nr:SRPBCC domain-containing protein [Salinimicrobium sp.]
MKRHSFKTEIDAPREKVWEILWGVETYPKWTRVFSETSQVETDWKEGSKVLFLDGNGNGMVSILEKNNPPEFMSFKHIGIMKDGKEITEGEEVKKWAPAYENYILKSNDGKTELVVDMDVNDESKNYFMETWPKAFVKIKELSE